MAGDTMNVITLTKHGNVYRVTSDSDVIGSKTVFVSGDSYESERWLIALAEFFEYDSSMLFNFDTEEAD